MTESSEVNHQRTWEGITLHVPRITTFRINWSRGPDKGDLLLHDWRLTSADDPRLTAQMLFGGAYEAHKGNPTPTIGFNPATSEMRLSTDRSGGLWGWDSTGGPLFA